MEDGRRERKDDVGTDGGLAGASGGARPYGPLFGWKVGLKRCSSPTESAMMSAISVGCLLDRLMGEKSGSSMASSSSRTMGLFLFRFDRFFGNGSLVKLPRGVDRLLFCDDCQSQSLSVCLNFSLIFFFLFVFCVERNPPFSCAC